MAQATVQVSPCMSCHIESSSLGERQCQRLGWDVSQENRWSIWLWEGMENWGSDYCSLKVSQPEACLCNEFRFFQYH